MDKINIASAQAPPSARTRAQSLPRHWSVASSKVQDRMKRAADINEAPFQFIRTTCMYLSLSARYDAA